MTKVTILGKSTVEKPKKKIEFVKCLDINEKMSYISSTQAPDQWEEVVLLRKSYTGEGLDLMYAYDTRDDRDHTCLFLGHFNDGVV